MKEAFTESTSQLMEKGFVKTSSWWKKTWLSMRGYTVHKQLQTPKGYSMGRLTYRKSWVLRPTDD